MKYYFIIVESTMKSKSNRSLGRPRAFNDKIEQNTVKSLDRALTVLTTLSKNQNKTLKKRLVSDERQINNIKGVYFTG